MRATNHHGRGTAKHAGRDFDIEKALHIHAERMKYNIYWTWNKGENLEVSERTYYSQQFSEGVEAQNERYRKKRNYSRIRTIDDVYENRVTQPEGSLLYIGSKDELGLVSRKELWKCVCEYVQWEIDYAKAHNNFYKPLSLALHADEDGQIHVEERGVYQYQDEHGHWRPGQNKALEAAGFPLPDVTKERDRYNNRKQVWDAGRREKWLNIIESHGFEVEREPEEHRPHLPLDAWQALQDEMRKIDNIRQQTMIKADEIIQQATEDADKIRQRTEIERQALNNRRQQLAAWERELEEQKEALEAREAVLSDIERETYQKALQSRRKARIEAQAQQAALELGEPVQGLSKGRKRGGKHSVTDFEKS